MSFKSNNPLKYAIGPLGLDCPFIAISKYHVEDRFFRDYSHSNSIIATCSIHKTSDPPYSKLTQ